MTSPTVPKIDGKSGKYDYCDTCERRRPVEELEKGQCLECREDQTV